MPPGSAAIDSRSPNAEFNCLETSMCRRSPHETEKTWRGRRLGKSSALWFFEDIVVSRLSRKRSDSAT